MSTDEAVFFDAPAAFRRWLEEHHRTATELWVGYWKKGTGRPSLTWQESVDEALCFGWIDGIRRSVDAERYRIRFTPRRAGSVWSAVNSRRAQELIAAGRMRAAGLAAFEARDEERTNRYSYERASLELDPSYAREFRRRRKAWAFFESQPPGYRRQVTSWIMSAKREETRRRRLDRLIEDSAAGLRIRELRR